MNLTKRVTTLETQVLTAAYRICTLEAQIESYRKLVDATTNELRAARLAPVAGGAPALDPTARRDWDGDSVSYVQWLEEKCGRGQGEY